MLALCSPYVLIYTIRSPGPAADTSQRTVRVHADRVHWLTSILPQLPAAP